MDRRTRPNALASGIHGTALALAIAMACVGGVGATPLEQGSGAPFGVDRTEHASYESTDLRLDAAPELDRGATAVVANGGGGALVINATFDSSITRDPNSAAIEGMLNNAIGVHESLFNDPIMVSIRFRYSTTYADGTTPLPSGALAVSESVVYRVPWDTFISALTGDATTGNDATANGSLPGPLSANMDPSSANGRAVGLTTPPVMFADGSLGPGGPYDGIITLNSRAAFKFTRPPTSGMYDAQRSTEHEIDEVLGLGSSINVRSDLRPQDLFSWSAAGLRNLMSTGSRYFSIDGGNTSIVGFNQDPNGDFGDWLSDSCPQANPYVQNAFSCTNQVSDVTQTSPEGINLDVIGYDPIMTTTTTSTTPTTTTTTLPCQPPQVECCPAGHPGCGVCGIDCGNGGCCPQTHPVCDNANSQCLVCEPPQVECCPPGQSGCGVCGTDCGNGACCPPAYPVCDNADSQCVVDAPSRPECSPGQVPCNDAALGFTDEACCSQPGKRKQCAAACSQIIADCKASCATSSHSKKCKKRCQTAIVGHCKKSRPHACS
jgi:hypothetical protein